MIYKCKNCSGNMFYHPEKRGMYCPFCDSMDTEEIVDGTNIHVCDCCGAPIEMGEYAIAGRCEACSQYVIFDDRIKGEYEPKKIIPFVVHKDMAKNLIGQNFGKSVFTPDSFLEEVTLRKLEGVYVPFWLYDFSVNCNYVGNGTKVSHSTVGDIQYTETAYYDVKRNMDILFELVPQDASGDMPNDIMDFMEPYDYTKLHKFNPKYMSGFLGEMYYGDAKIFEPRAVQKAGSSSEKILKSSMNEYSYTADYLKNIAVTSTDSEYVLLPVWRYLYEYKGNVYPYYVNGQTGKVIGQTPISFVKKITYTLTFFSVIFFGALMVLAMLGGMF